MLSDRFIKFFTIWTNWIACPIGAVPFRFDKGKRLVFTNFSIQRKPLRMWIFLAANNVLLIGSVLHPKNRDVTYFNELYSGWVINSICVLVLGSLALQAQPVCFTYNSTITFLKRFKESFMPNYNANECRLNSKIDFHCSLIACVSVAIATMETTYYIMLARDTPLYLTYYIPEKYYIAPVIIVSLVLHAFVFFNITVHLGNAAVLSISVSVHAFQIVSKDINCTLRNHTYRTMDSLRTGKNMRITYRTLQLLLTIFLESAGKILYPMNWLMLKMVTFMGGMVIKHGHKMEPLVFNLTICWVLFGLVMWGGCLEMNGRLFLYSQRAINSWKYHDWEGEGKVMSKFRKSCKPLKMGYHNFFSIKRLSVLNFFKSVARNIFKAIVAL
ncbi:unnamed protein product [Orchesella dallaii]|uniref:Odorant receptor n=1 Tax=Orchesella dallaii TaxID=48710 RepID=A0ABP1S6N9_9HEXA